MMATLFSRQLLSALSFLMFRLGKNHRDPKTGSWRNLLLSESHRINSVSLAFRDGPSTYKDWAEKNSRTHIKGEESKCLSE